MVRASRSSYDESRIDDIRARQAEFREWMGYADRVVWPGELAVAVDGRRLLPASEGLGQRQPGAEIRAGEA